MTTTNGTPVEETSVELGDATSWAENIVHTAINMRASERLSGAALRMWGAGALLIEAGGGTDHRLGVKLSLDALIMQPEVLAWVAREARDHLAKVEAAKTTPVPTKTTWLQNGPKALAVIRALEARARSLLALAVCLHPQRIERPLGLLVASTTVARRRAGRTVFCDLVAAVFAPKGDRAWLSSTHYIIRAKVASFLFRA